MKYSTLMVVTRRFTKHLHLNNAAHGTGPQFASMLTEYLPTPSGLRLPMSQGRAK